MSLKLKAKQTVDKEVDSRVTTDNVGVIHDYLLSYGYNLNCFSGGSGSSEYDIREIDLDSFCLVLPLPSKEFAGHAEINGELILVIWLLSLISTY